MDKLKVCAVSFEALLNIKYRCIVGRRGRAKEFILAFESHHFHHLAGLHKLSDKHALRGSRERVFKNILADKITYASINNSKDFPLVEARLNYLHALEQFMDSNALVFKYDRRKNVLSSISADYLLQN